MTAAILTSLPCKICTPRTGRWKPRHEFNRVHAMQGNICAKCMEHHEEALLVFAHNGMPKGCADCDQPLVENQKMFLHVKDGIYQLLCPTCSDGYAARCGQYAGTAYEHLKKLKGYK